MSFFSETVRAAAEKRDIGSGLLVFMDFMGAPRRWWTGFGKLQAGGQEWLGLGSLIGVEGIEWQGGTTATEATFTLSGVDAGIVSQARASKDNVVGRRVIVYIQMFHTSATRGAGEQVHANLDQPVAVWSGKMGSPRFSAPDLSSRTIVVPAETLWADRNRPPFGLYTDRSQKGRHPGDRGLEQVSRLTHKSVNWPATDA